MPESFLSLDPYIIVIIILNVSLIYIYYIALLEFSDVCSLNCLQACVSVQKSS
jgi:hypothetical protein